MSQPFLEEQLRRIRQMTARIAEARERQHELSERIEREIEDRRNRDRRDMHTFEPPVVVPAHAHPQRREEPHRTAERPIGNPRSPSARRHR